MSRSSKKLKYLDKYMWRKLVLSLTLKKLNNFDKFTYNRSSIFINNDLFSHFYIYKGNTWFKKLLNPWVIGFKLGEFSWNKVPAQFKSKRLSKKR